MSGALRFMVKNYLDDFLFVIGAVLIVTGIAQIYPPAAWIVAGAFSLVGGWLVARANGHEVQDDPKQSTE